MASPAPTDLDEPVDVAAWLQSAISVSDICKFDICRFDICKFDICKFDICRFDIWKVHI